MLYLEAQTNFLDMKKLFVFFLIIICSDTFFAQTISFVNRPCSSNGCFTKRFQATDIPSHFNQFTGSYRFFWYMGDGTYYDYEDVIDGNLDLAYVDHTYKQDGNYEVYMEAVPRYEDDKPPKRFYPPNGIGTFSVVCGSNQPCSSSNLTSVPSSSFSIKTNRDMVKGDMFSYVLTYSHNCKELGPISGYISLSFPTNKLEMERPSIHYGISASDVSIVNSSSDTTITWNINNLNTFETRNIIVPLRVKNVSGINTGDNIDVQINVAIGNCIGPIGMSYPTEVKNSHDPNNLDSDQSFICEIVDADNLLYTIRYQNFGDKEADTVIVKNVIPDAFDKYSIETVYPPFTGVDSIHVNIPGTREVRWVLTDDLIRGPGKLHGTKEVGFGDYIFEENTIDSIQFKVTKKPDFSFEKCNAIVNQAELIFDCNPSIYTEPHIFRIQCLDTFFVVIPPDSIPGIDTIICDPCSETLFLDLDSVVFDDALSSAVQLKFPPNVMQNLIGRNLLWYPSEGLDDSTLTEPFASPIKSTDYYLVASSTDPCRRTIVKKRVEIPCNLEITAIVDCNNSNNKNITATVNSTSKHLKWQDCSFGDKFQYFNTSNDVFYLSVVDTMNNCSATLNVEMVCPVKPRGGSLASWNIFFGVLIMSIALGYVLYHSGWP